ncbi:MAG: hypothetical protein WAQ22_02330 [Candidatus Saccharimonas sp.]
MNWGDDSSTPRGRYFVSGYSGSDGYGYFNIVYWDYKNEGWTVKYWEWWSDEMNTGYDSGIYRDPSSGETPCKAEKLEQCKMPVYN